MDTQAIPTFKNLGLRPAHRRSADVTLTGTHASLFLYDEGAAGWSWAYYVHGSLNNWAQSPRMCATQRGAKRAGLRATRRASFEAVRAAAKAVRS